MTQVVCYQEYASGFNLHIGGDSYSKKEEEDIEMSGAEKWLIAACQNLHLWFLFLKLG